jgi:outer membrane receptor protein involved in Fe transport
MPDGDFYQANIEGVDARHMGLEADFKWRPTRNLTLTGMATLSENIWKNDLEDVPIYDDNENLLGTVDLYIADLKVGDAAQTLFALGADYELLDGFKVGVDWNYFDNLYAEFDPLGRGSSEDKGVQPWKVPSYNVIDANFVYNFRIGDFDAALIGNISNLFDTEFITDADDGGSHDWESARVYYGIGRTWLTSLRINF